MLKKAGIVVAAAAATLLAVSPLAFAGDGHDGSGDVTSSSDNTVGFVNVTDNNVNMPIQACNNDVPIQGGAFQGQVPVKNIAGALSGALSLTGDATSSSTATVEDNRYCEQGDSNAGDS